MFILSNCSCNWGGTKACCILVTGPCTGAGTFSDVGENSGVGEGAVEGADAGADAGSDTGVVVDADAREGDQVQGLSSMPCRILVNQKLILLLQKGIIHLKTNDFTRIYNIG